MRILVQVCTRCRGVERAGTLGIECALCGSTQTRDLEAWVAENTTMPQIVAAWLRSTDHHLTAVHVTVDDMEGGEYSARATVAGPDIADAIERADRYERARETLKREVADVA